MFFIISLCLLNLSQVIANDKIDDSNQRQVLVTKVANQEAQAAQLINLLRQFNNERFSSDIEKGNAEEAYFAFLASFQTLKEDKSTLERKELSSSVRDLENYSLRFDNLIKDLQKYLK
jgi:hypothetical protein